MGAPACRAHRAGEEVAKAFAVLGPVRAPTGLRAACGGRPRSSQSLAVPGTVRAPSSACLDQDLPPGIHPATATAFQIIRHRHKPALGVEDLHHQLPGLTNTTL